uniref:Reverse transcriptase n=1 Tax=Phytophthora ramorum TaxID=164328 RepID=H3GBI2_PHYRM
MTSSTIFSTLDLRDGFYQILMRESDIPLTAVSSPSGVLWEWLVMPQGLKNAPATFNRCVTHLLRSVRDFAPSYFDDVFIHSRAVNGKSDVEMHTEHLRKLLELMRKHKLYANLKKYIFGATEIPVLGCLVGKNGVRPDPGKELRQFLGLATYLCKYVSNYAGKIRPLSQLLKKEAAWEWTADCQQAFEAVKQGLTKAPILAVADQDRPFHVLADGKPFRVARREVSLPYTFDGFRSNDNFIVFEMNYAFDCILGIPWLSRYQPQIDWLARSVKRRRDFDVSEVFTHLLVAPRDWPHVTVMDGTSTTHVVRRASDGPLCTTCAVLLTDDDSVEHPSGYGRARRAVEHPRLPRTRNKTAERTALPATSTTVEQGLPRVYETVEQGLPYDFEAVEQGLPYDFEAVEQGLPYDDTAVEQELLPRMSGAVEHGLSRLEEGEVSSGDSETSVLSRGSRRTKTSRRSRRRLKPRRSPVELTTLPIESVCAVEYVGGVPNHARMIKVASPPRDAKSITDLPGLSWKSFLRDLKAGDIEQLNDATIPAQTPIPRKDMVLDSMSRSVIYRAIDLTDGFYQILMREGDVPLTAVSTPSGMLWEWLVMPQGLKNAPAIFNRMVSHVLRPLRDFAPSYFDDIFVHSHAEEGLSAIDVHLRHLRQVFQVMRENKLYANLKKCVFCAPEIPVLGCYISKNGVRADPEKVSSICSWPPPLNPTELRQWLGLANYLHKYTKGYAGLIQPLSSLLKKDATWSWRPEHQVAFDSVKKSLASAPILMLPDDAKPFHVVCDASDFAIGCALMQFDNEGCERVVSYQSRQMKPAERNYPVHDKELLAMRYALIKFRVYLLGEQTFAVYTDHASLRTAMKSPHLSQCMARWLSFFAEYNFVVHYKPGKNNILADALSRRPDYDPRATRGHQVIDEDEDDEDHCAMCLTSGVNLMNVTPEMPLREDIAVAYNDDAVYAAILAHLLSPSDKTLRALPNNTRNQINRYQLDGDLLTYSIDRFDAPRIAIPNDDDLRARIIHVFHDSPVGGHLGREKTFAAVSRDFYWPHMYKWVRKWVRTCEICQRVKPSKSSQVPLRSLPIAAEAWRSVSMDFIFGLPPDADGRTGVLVFVDRFSKMVHLIPVSDTITAAESAVHFVDAVFRHHGLPESIVSDRDPRFTSAFWSSLFQLLGTKLLMSTAAHPETDGQTERVN